MHLKSIEINGFKSFANRIRFEFPGGITGIVGPNGSGKSNVADAIRWVFGEQRVKQLRSSKMEDVIFAGTALRKPMGYAYVALTLDNSDRRLNLDYDEITVSRRVYRTGESEYMINGSACRLRDVQELFYDTGIGKEGYSIIGQGQIDKILQGKPEERRELFDEAAGIVKYKKRKTIALKKLENERLNLTRINDILSELEKQVGPLKKQSESALKFVEYRKELREYDVNLFLIESSQIKDKIKQYAEKERITSDDLDEERARLEQLKIRYEELNSELTELESGIEETKNKIARGNIIKETLIGQINVLNEQINAANDAKSHYKERIDALMGNIKRSQEQRQKLEEDKRSNQKALSEAIANAADTDNTILDVQNRYEELRTGEEQLKEKLIELIDQKGDINANIERMHAVAEQISEQKQKLIQDLERFSEDKSRQEKALERISKDMTDIQGGIERKQKEIVDKEKELSEYNDSLFAHRRQSAICAQEIAGLNAKLESVKNMTERYEGYGQSIQEVMKLKSSYKGIYGVVADIIRTEKKYETAVETALGAGIRNIVTDTEATAKAAIEYLKKNKLGRATFLPVKAVMQRTEFKNESVLSEEGVIGMASSLVDTDEQYRGVVNYLLGRIVVCDNVDNALRIARKYKYSLMIVTLEGEQLNRGGSLSGGAYKNKSNLLGRRREIDELADKISRSENVRDGLDKEIKILEEKISLSQADIARVKEELHEENIKYNITKVSLEQAKSRHDEIVQELSGADAARQDMDSQSEEMIKRNTDLAAALEANASETDHTKLDISKIQEQMSSLKSNEASLLEKRNALNEERSRLTGQNSVIVNSVIKLENELQILESEIKKIESQAKDALDGDIERSDQIEEINNALKRAEGEGKILEGSLSELEKKKCELASSNKDYIEKRENAQSRIAELDKEVFRLSQLKEKQEEHFEARNTIMWEEYELTYNSALEYRNEELNDARSMREHINDLKSSIRSLGVINVSAIEEYKEIKERYEFMSGQQQDLKRAEEDLIRIIKDLDKAMRKQFNSEFGRIQEEFSKVFSEMFGGGIGTISLEEDADVLEAGITITAQPPGKKLQNMMQLSGGEKALTAIAVLFAIQNLKPSPFCILDEIEAALDDSNIDRFAAYLHKLENDVQFIVITHRKGTMEAAARLYGITMQERGVSSLISVDLTDYDEKQLEIS